MTMLPFVLMSMGCEPDPDMILRVTPAEICDCTDVTVSWETTARSPVLRFDPEIPGAIAGPVEPTGEQVVRVCEETRVVLAGERFDTDARAFVPVEQVETIDDVSDTPTIVPLSFRIPFCSEERVWRGDLDIPEDAAPGLVVDRLDIGPPTWVRHQSGAEFLVTGSSDAWAGEDPGGPWIARPEIGLVACEGATGVGDGLTPPPATLILVCPGP